MIRIVSAGYGEQGMEKSDRIWPNLEKVTWRKSISKDGYSESTENTRLFPVVENMED